LKFRWRRLFMARRIIAVMLFLAALGAVGFATQTASVQASPPSQSPVGDPGRGAYLFALNGGCGCHQGAAGFLAGGEVFDLGPAGKVYAPNISSDPETGIGDWSEEDIVNVLRTGKAPDGEQLFPIMPYPYFSGMSNQDMHDLAAFIKSAPPVKNEVPASVLNIPVSPFSPRPQPESAPADGVARGDYLVNTIMICGDCHTPQGPEGVDFARFLAGNQVDPENFAPNITPDMETGIGSWSQEQIYLELKTGKKPDGNSLGGLMALQIEGGYKDITEKDGFAVAAYLKTIPAIHNMPDAAAAPTAPPAAPPQTLPSTGTDPYNVPLVLGLLAGGAMLLLGGVVVWRNGRKT
jgi:LPXTG-motif cell wall-anchored protein